jgi:hypothetical protein
VPSGKVHGECGTRAGHRRLQECLLLSALVVCGSSVMHAGRWSTICEALDNWPKTVRLCLIIAVMQLPVPFLLWLVMGR